MLSYRHSFHAGNPADIIKHLVLANVLEYMTRKDKPLDYVDTHSGAGFFELSSSDAQKTQEYLDGIAKLWHYRGHNDAIKAFVDLVKSFNDDTLAFYPGSPKVAEQFLRRQDKGWFFELHPKDSVLLTDNLAHKKSLRVRSEDGFKGLLGLVPPLSRRACVLMDPPYEIKTDYQQAAKMIIKAYKKFNSGTYMIWYPVVDRARIDLLEQTLIESGVSNVQLFELATSADTQEHGMTASGMIVINAPWTLKATMDSVLPELVEILSDEAGFYRSEQLVAE
ncbi:23S rRNA (adenine(2030)-N(6))-methyltransferase RlmJ [Pseudoalteromonas aurantia]|jgi:23S rRNA (adenine2030-N6)-methyltransferase|uniref:Ribosomal RNA large subunit methyltransferase J n=2 Tax=Pseudoalteromonas TaxID=53246 RepID=A0A5S3UZ97_9GAMM|nr:23S rRNA (adenine(2030)-N(6))-methyltransferase RlmJ [Pseudoalteromonas aurantia]TMO63201.1 23S rRNA (adenine(2030)-N(6))-methyltransferase RlmJ [Pseudoalteromonas aurantia]TMO64821.1 23S rRNA (adenine(2030)-N(6))-methyltransferase RlmJ [Pseudoalteromonas aurantia]TMO71086.1 23S rRNA (adenine(2030)-N(6))-methyltransferase RlmJ [Pseudoalteromonas aurantia]